MRFLGLLKRKKTETKEKDYIPKSDKKSSRQQTAPADQLSFLVDNCELISESDRQIEEAKVEYQAVTSYLTDMQRIDMSLKEQREKLEEAARNIYNLTRERNLFQQKNTILTDRQYQ